ncbi:MAG: AMP-binding protein, partial [Bacteroidota bacterium]
MKGMHTLGDVIREASMFPDKGITFIGTNQDEFFLSYQQLYRRAKVVLNNLSEQGVERGDQVILQIKDEQHFLMTFWGCLLGGIVPVPLSIGGQSFYKEKFVTTWNTLHHPFLVHDAEALKGIQEHCRKHELASLEEAVASRSADVELVARGEREAEPLMLDPTSIAYIQFSSGSTGNAKGVTLTHENLVANISDIARRSAITSEDAMLSWMPLTHDMGLICFHLTGVITGIRQYIMPTPLFVKRPLLWMDKTSEHRISLLYSPNFGYHYLLSALNGQKYPWSLSTVRLIYNGAEPISSKLIDEFMRTMEDYGLRREAMYPGYGMAEACVAVTLAYQDKPYQTYWLDRNFLQIGTQVLEAEPRHENAVSFVSVGSPIDQCEIRIANDREELLPDNCIGHIQIKGANTTKGYYNNEEATRKLLTSDSWLRTGDLGFVRDNILVITGRAKNLIIINGQNYYPQDIESVILDDTSLTTGTVVACGGKNFAQDREELLIFVLFRKS